MSRSSRMSASSSITSIWLVVMLASRRTAQDGKARALRRLDVLQARIVRFAHFARDVETEPGPAPRRREERLEELTPQLRRHARAVVHDVELDGRGACFLAHDQADARI